MLETARKYIEEHFKPDAKIAIGVSGGRDSMCLLTFVLEMNYFARENVTVVHVDHNLRETAERDAAFVRDFCAANKVPFLLRSVDVRAECARTGASVETAARNLRYEVFDEVLSDGVAEKLMTAHHALDRVETTLMHIARGSGLDGLIGIQDSRHFARPFLNEYPETLHNYAVLKNVAYVEDETNKSDEPDRNYLRHVVIPLIEKRYPAFVKSVNMLSDEAATSVAILDTLMRNDYVLVKGGEVKINLAAGKTELCNRYVMRAIKVFQIYLGKQVNFDRVHVERVASLFDAPVGTLADVNGGIRAARDNDCVALFIENPKCLDEVPCVIGKSVIGGITVEIEKAKKKKLERGMCDFDKLSDTTIRFRRDGDIFKPYGGGTKKLKEYFIDEKIPRRKRDNMPLIVRGSEVLCIIGLEISDKVKIDENTKRIVKASIQKRKDPVKKGGKKKK